MMPKNSDEEEDIAANFQQKLQFDLHKWDGRPIKFRYESIFTYKKSRKKFKYCFENLITNIYPRKVVPDLPNKYYLNEVTLNGDFRS